MSLRRVLWIALATGLVLALVAGGWFWLHRSEDWVAVRRGDLELTVDIEGELEAIETSRLGPPGVSDLWNYKIAMLAPEGAEVRAGTPVLAFDTAELQQKLVERQVERDSAAQEIEQKKIGFEEQRREAQLRLREAESRLRRARLEADAPEDLIAATDQREARLDVALAEKEIGFLRDRLEAIERQGKAELRGLQETRIRAQQRVAELQESLGRMRIVAPRDGTVVYLEGNRRNQEKPKIGDSIWRAQQVLEIPDLSRMRALAWVDEAEARRVQLGQRAQFRLDAHPEVAYWGTVSDVGRSVQKREDGAPIKVVRLEIDIDETDAGRMRPGMRLRGTVAVESLDEILVIPTSAVQTTAAGPRVLRRSLTGFESVVPTLGAVTGDEVQVVDGLVAGDQIALHPGRVAGGIP